MFKLRLQLELELQFKLFQQQTIKLLQLVLQQSKLQLQQLGHWPQLLPELELEPFLLVLIELQLMLATQV